tara:strand:+ start:3052 stop:3210 length:159 start_codon:yes stop_codon:yes gene_type:complete
MKDKSDSKVTVVDTKSMRKSVAVNKAKAFNTPMAAETFGKKKAGKLVKDSKE